MTYRAPADAEVLRRHVANSTELRAVCARRRGRRSFLLEVDSSSLGRLLAGDDDRLLYRVSEYDSQAELFSAFDRASLVLGR